MIYSIPFIYFLCLFIYVYKKKGLDIASYTISLYVITSFCTILIMWFDYKPYSTIETPILSTFLYCFLLTICIVPLIKMNTNKIKYITCVNSRFIDLLVYLYFSVFLILIFAYWRDLITLILSNDWDRLRNLLYHDEDIAISRYSGIVETILLPIRVLALMSSIMFIVFFYVICYMKKPIYYYIMILLGTLPMIIVGILGIDRSKTFYWLILLGLTTSFFWKKLPVKRKKIISIALLLLGGIAIAYIVTVTISRFGYRNEGAEGGAIAYAGQPYLYFCDFTTNWENPEGYTTKFLFPATHKYILHDYIGNVPYQQWLTMKTNKFCGQFYTFLGSHYLAGNWMGVFSFMLLYLLLISYFVGKMNKPKVEFRHVFIGYFLILIPSTGCISYFYTYPPIVLNVLLFTILCLWYNKGETIKRELR